MLLLKQPSTFFRIDGFLLKIRGTPLPHQDHGSKISIHQQCAWYAAGRDMVQGDDWDIFFDAPYSVKRLNGYLLTAIQECIKSHQKR